MRRAIWSDLELDILRRQFPTTPSSEIAAQMGRSLRAVRAKAAVLGLKKSDEYYQNCGGGRIKKGNQLSVETQFKKGGVSWNKGRKMPGNGGKTSFSVGHLPHNTLHDGAITIRKIKGRPYKFVRVALGKWKPLHREVWEQHFGQIPAGMNVQFIDGDPMNCCIENLRMMSKQQNLAENSIHNYPQELKTTIKKLSLLNKKIRSHASKQNR